MNRVLSFPQRHSCDDPAEAVSKRFCFSCIMSVSFLSLIFGYLLGSRRSTNLPVFEKSDRDYLETLNGDQLYNKKIDMDLLSGNKSSSDYNEVAALRAYFERNKFDQVSEIFSTSITLTFRDESCNDAIEVIEVIGDHEGVHYRNKKETPYPYSIPKDATPIQNFSNVILGLPVYLNFGTQDDYDYISRRKISIRDHVVILRLGQISSYEKVVRALRSGAKGVLLFADPQQYPRTEKNVIPEDLSPTLLTRIQKLRECFPCGPNCSVGIQVISARAAGEILTLMDVANRPPHFWHGSLTTNYSIGPGFFRKNWHLTMKSYYTSVQFTSYDVAAYLRGVDEPDRYVIVSNSRKNFVSPNSFPDSTDVLVKVSKALAELKHGEKWAPTRTIIFLSMGFENLEFSENSWMQKHVDIIECRTVAHLNIKVPVPDSQLNMEVCPVLEDVISNTTFSTMNVSRLGNFRAYETRRINIPLLDENECENELANGIYHHVRTKSRLRNSNNSNLREEDIAAKISSHLKIPTINFAFVGENLDDGVTGSFKRRNTNIQEENYITDTIKLWSLLTFSLSSAKILPFNFSMYSSMVENYREKISFLNETDGYKFVEDNYVELTRSLENFTFTLPMFHETIRNSTNKSSLVKRIINDKLMLIQKLFTCVLDTYEIVLTYLNGTRNTETSFTEDKLNKGIICATEISFLIQSSYD